MSKSLEELQEYVDHYLKIGQYEVGEIMVASILKNDGRDILESIEQNSGKKISFGDWFDRLTYRQRLVYELAVADADLHYDTPGLAQVSYGCLIAWRRYKEENPDE